MSEGNETAELEALLEHLKSSRGVDFTAYKRSTLARRIDKRMALINVASYTDYLDYLEVHPEEFGQLFNAILINVTSFFRDPEHSISCARRSSRRCCNARTRTNSCASGAPAAPRAKSATRSRCCSPKRWGRSRSANA